MYDRGEGVLQFKARAKLRLVVKGDSMAQGNPLILDECVPRTHELFKLKGEVLRATANGDHCLDVEGGVEAGNKIIAFPCPKDKKTLHEEFEFDELGRIRLARNNDFCVNARGGIGLGAELILWHCGETAQPNELFELAGGVVRALHNPDLHFNIRGGDITKSAPLVLWRCEASQHAIFEFTERGQVRPKASPELCLNAEGGLEPGRSIVLWPCSTQKVVPHNEFFSYDEEKQLIYAATEPNLVFTADIAKATDFQSGDRIMLWPLQYKTEL